MTADTVTTYTISVIIPVYNAEKYLKRCVDSVLAQTCRQFEMILIDDGSTDGSGGICDEYAARDERIAAMHQQNKGQSAARNAGLDYAFAHGGSEWIAFIDSDDWVNEKYLETLLYSAVSRRVKVSACEYMTVKGEDDAGQAIFCGDRVMSAEQCYCENNAVCIVPVAKLYAKALWKDIRFPEGMIHEDEFVIYRVIFEAGQIACTSAPMYYYYQSEKSTMRSGWTHARLNALEGKRQQMKYMIDNGYPKAYRKAVSCYAYVLCMQMDQINGDPALQKQKRRLRNELKRHILRYRLSGCFSLRRNRKYYTVAFPAAMRMVKMLASVFKPVKKSIRSITLKR